MKISVKVDISGLERKLQRLVNDQVPFATAKALTQTAHAVNEAIKSEMRSRFKGGPTAYSLRAFKIKAATKRDLRAVVSLRDDSPGKGTIWHKALGHLFMGGTRKYKSMEGAFNRIGVLPNGFMMVPGAACPLDGNGNPPRSLIVQLISYFKAFGEQGYKSNMTDKRRGTLAKAGRSESGYKTINGVVYFISRGPGTWYGRPQHLPAGIWAKSGTHGVKVAPVFLFVKAGHWGKAIDLDSLARATVAREFPKRFSVALREATSR